MFNPFAPPTIDEAARNDGGFRPRTATQVLAWVEIVYGFLWAVGGVAFAWFFRGKSDEIVSFDDEALRAVVAEGVVGGLFLVTAALLLRSGWRWRWWFQVIPALYLAYAALPAA